MPALARRAPRRQAFYGAARLLAPRTLPCRRGLSRACIDPTIRRELGWVPARGRDGGVETPQGDAVAEELVRVDARRPAVPWRGHGVCPGAIAAHLRLGPQPRPVA